MPDFYTVLMLVGFGFLGAFINAIVGGGGLITVPALLAVGLPPAVAIGTNKLAAATGNLTSMLTFMRAGKVDWRLLWPVLPWVFVASMCGAVAVHQISPQILQPLVIVLLVVVLLYSLWKKDLGRLQSTVAMTPRRKLLACGLVVGLGFYDGFFGPGTGSFMIMALLFMGMDFVRAAGSSKLLNLTSNTAAMLTFMWLGSVHYVYGLIMAAAMMAGAYAGSRMALSRGTAFVRMLFIAVTSVLILKNLYDLL
ncbi:TSUP family transporter [Thiopseudomonas denitrificans]|uniref:Probable membrane transporter protein n=1 Tax=Thiopseudomonas denitrificans TaxID=1501432 RepID=A0A4R6TWN6_9GAMM|nr:TSUP family transporter [Thiopseudomonas denitrificans]TDQ36673.1 hypothetical protein DFQ45_11154 [Thiopseudomonas denitrificans]